MHQDEASSKIRQGGVGKFATFTATFGVATEKTEPKTFFLKLKDKKFKFKSINIIVLEAENVSALHAFSENKK